MSNHVCDIRKCCGKKYDGFYIRCTECNEPTMVDCIFEHVQTQTLLRILGLYNKATHVHTRNDESEKLIKSLFGKNSPFGFICSKCKSDMNELEDKLNEAKDKLKHTQKLLENARKNNDQMNTADDIDIENTADNVNKQSDITPKLELFVSSFPANTECDAITAFILEKTSLLAENFEVSKMANPKVKKYRKFMSFKVKTYDKASYDMILNDDIWKPFAKAVPFDSEARTKTKERKQQQQSMKAATVKRPHPKPVVEKPVVNSCLNSHD